MNKLKHTFIVAACVALASQFSINFFVQGFIITLSVILFPVLLYNYSELNPIKTAFVTGIVSPLFRGIIVYLTNGDINQTIIMVAPDIAFYFAYGIFFYLIYYRNEKKDLTLFIITVFGCDFLSNIVEMSVRTKITGMGIDIIKGLLIIAAVRSLIVLIIIVSMKQYKSFLVEEEHENRYRKLILLTSSFKSEIYFMNKNINEIEDVMKKSYIVYKTLDENNCHNEIKNLALDIAKDVHEIKKDYISVIRGLEGMSKDNIDVIFMDIKDIISILEQDTMEYMKNYKLDIDTKFKVEAHFTVQDHFYLMAVLRNLVNNSIEAIGDRKRGSVELLIYEDSDSYVFNVSDNGSGIKESNLDYIFNPGFSTKFEEATGKIERGIGLTLVRDLVRDKFKGEITVKSVKNKGTTFMIKIPKHVFRGNDLKYYMVDDDKNIIKVLANIIEEKELGEVIGSSEDSNIALKEILMLNPDIVLVDLLMPKLDGNSLVREVKSIKPRIDFIMISQVSDSELVADSYNSGIEFFIGKPINIIEVEKVIKKIAEKIQLENILNDIQKVFKNIPVQKDTGRENIKEIKYILSMLGMLGEKGTNDIFKACIYLMDNNKSYDDCHIDYICDNLGDNSKTVKQRMRRAVKSGLTNLANLGLEDYSNESFQSYSNILFDFENVKAEMDYIRGKREKEER